jgi:hypothetical protein
VTAATAPRRPVALPIAGAPQQVHPPPFLLPAEHFVAALGWLAIGAAGLILISPDLAAGNIFAPRVLAVTHMITLGVITTTIFGALYQLFPVTMGRAARSIRAGHATFWLLQAGAALVVTGFWRSSGPVLGCGWLVVTLAVVLFGVNLVSHCLGTQPDRLVGWYVGAGYLALIAALGLGSLRVGETLGYWHVDRGAMISSHFHLAALGFATCVAIGIGNRMVPMFLVSHGFPRWPLQWIGPLGAVGMIVFAIGRFAGQPTVVQIGGTLMATAVGLYLYLGWEYFRRRLRRTLDPGLAHVAAAFGFLGAVLVVGLRLLFGTGGFAPRTWAAYATLALLGWLVLLVVGVLYKILPFLTWLHLFGPRMGEPTAPTVADLTRSSWGWASLACLVGGLGLVVPAIGFGSALVARIGAAGFGLGVALLLLQAGRVLRLRFAP